MCAREDGIRRSKDLRAEIGKFLNSTNERKQMSIKTIKQRIALVAVTALSAGVLSFVSAPAAKAAYATGASAGEFYINTTNSTSGAAVLDAGAYSATVKSVGWIAETSTTASGTTTGGRLTTSGAYTANVFAGAQIAFSASNTATNADGVSVVVTGGTLGSVDTTSGTLSLNGARTIADVDGGTDDTLYGVFTVSAAAGSTATIAAYSGTGVTNLTPTAGALLGLWTLTVVPASTVGVYDAGESTVTQQACIAKDGTSSAAFSYDTTSRCANGYVGVIYVNLSDSYESDVSGGVLAATATNGSNVYVEGSSIDANDAYLAVTAFDTETAADTNWIVVTQPVANTAGSTTVTITYQGAVVGTKTINWGGDVAKLTVVAASSSSAMNNGASESLLSTGVNTVVYAATDAAGNILTLTSQPSVTGATGSMVGASTSTTTVATIAAVQTSSRGYGYTTINHPGGSTLRGAGSYKLKLTNSAGATITSDEVKVTVSLGSTASFTASWDKAVYNPGDIAELTITLKDAYGNLMATGTTMAGLTAGLIPPGTAAAGFAQVGSTCVNDSTVTAGVRTCKYGAGNVAGSYNWSVDLDTTGGANQSPAVGSISISAGSAVSNADVLKSIVALIASINKQIQALQKLILKR